MTARGGSQRSGSGRRHTDAERGPACGRLVGEPRAQRGLCGEWITERPRDWRRGDAHLRRRRVDADGLDDIPGWTCGHPLSRGHPCHAAARARSALRGPGLVQETTDDEHTLGAHGDDFADAHRGVGRSGRPAERADVHDRRRRRTAARAPSSYDAATRTQTSTSPLGRQTDHDVQRRRPAGADRSARKLPIIRSYNTHGQPTGITVGTRTPAR